MRTFLLIAGAAFASAQVAGKCDVCHLHYFHKEVSSKEVFADEVKQCREYSHESCCTAKIAKGVSKVAEGYLYPGYNHEGCGELSAACKAYFIQESCFYECDKNLGKWRKHTDCKDGAGEENGWEIEKMPIKKSVCDGWHAACKDDKFCHAKDKNYFSLPTCNTTTSCKKFGDIYANGKEVCEVMWGGSFKYEEDESKGYVFTFEEGKANPNNDVFSDKKYPEVCKGQEVNHTDAIVTDGCPADWHYHENSGHPLAGKAPPAPPSGAATASSFIAAAIAAAAALMMFA